MATRMTEPFDASAWLEAFAEAGGGYAMAANRKLLFAIGIEAPGIARLLSHLDAIHLHPERRDAIRDAIDAKQNREAPA